MDAAAREVYERMAAALANDKALQKMARSVASRSATTAIFFQLLLGLGEQLRSTIAGTAISMRSRRQGRSRSIDARASASTYCGHTLPGPPAIARKKMRCGHSVFRHRNRRTRMLKATDRSPIGRSATQRW
jgi:hypothetical protein